MYKRQISCRQHRFSIRTSCNVPSCYETCGTKPVSYTHLLTGISLTKLDGTAKGGVIFAIADQFNLPIRYIGVGEKIEDLREFNAEEFIEALFVDENEEYKGIIK